MSPRSDTSDPFDSKRFLATLTSRPGVYRMLNAAGEVIYVGKAGNLKKRVATYFSGHGKDAKTQSMVSQVCGVDITVTNTEGEALLLENNLIKTLAPRYNIMLRDDKSYPYIYLSTDQSFPRLGFHRGARRGKGTYFGPYPSAGAVRASLGLLQKIFPIRQCEDSFYRNRSRPCLQYQIKRCTAPCVGLVEPEQYGEDVRHATLFLSGRSQEVVEELAKEMNEAAGQLAFERAAQRRDQIANLRRVQEQQYLEGGTKDLDLLACVIEHGAACVQVVYIRDGRNLGDRGFFPEYGTPHATSRLFESATPGEVLRAFIAQHYLGREVPQELLVNCQVKDRALLEKTLTDQTGRRVRIGQPRRGDRAQWLKIAATNASMALKRRLASRAGTAERYEALRQALKLVEPIERMECFDISHTMGEATVASCVVFDGAGPLKSDYRKFNIENVAGGDDYAAMAQAINRRYARILKGETRLPDVLLIDGGKGQLSAVAHVLKELQVPDLCVVAVAKGPERRPGAEVLFRLNNPRPLLLPATSPALHLIQQIRDEAHRFAIAGHRARRAKRRQRSALEEIGGLGPKRRQALLTHFGGLQGVNRAGVKDLVNVAGISEHLARAIYDHLHDTSA